MTDQPTETETTNEAIKEKILIRAINSIKTGISRQVFEANQAGLLPAARNHNREVALKLRGPWTWKKLFTKPTKKPQNT